MKHEISVLIHVINKKITKLKSTRSRAVTPIIATILILALVVSGVAIGFVQILPYIEQSRVESGSANIQASLIKIDNVFEDMISDSSGNYFPDSYPSRKLQVNLPIGTLKNLPRENNITYEPQLCPGSVCPASFSGSSVLDSYGALKHSFSSTYALIPKDTLEYLSGSDPFQRRDMVATISLSSPVTEETTPTNLTLYRQNFDHFLELSYRPRIFITQSIESGLPTYKIGIFFIKLITESNFYGVTNIYVKLTNTTVTESILTGTSGDSFQTLFQIGNTVAPYAPVTASLGGFTTQYIVKTTTFHFSITG